MMGRRTSSCNAAVDHVEVNYEPADSVEFLTLLKNFVLLRLPISELENIVH